MEFDRARKGLEQQVGQPVSQEMAVENKFDVRLLDELATREAFAALLQKIGVHPSDELIKQQIEKIPNFFDQVSGRFDKNLYAQTLQQNNLTVARFESGIRDEIAQQHVVAAMVNACGCRAPMAPWARSTRPRAATSATSPWTRAPCRRWRRRPTPSSPSS